MTRVCSSHIYVRVFGRIGSGCVEEPRSLQNQSAGSGNSKPLFLELFDDVHRKVLTVFFLRKVLLNSKSAKKRETRNTNISADHIQARQRGFGSRLLECIASREAVVNGFFLWLWESIYSEWSERLRYPLLVSHLRIPARPDLQRVRSEGSNRVDHSAICVRLADARNVESLVGNASSLYNKDEELTVVCTPSLDRVRLRLLAAVPRRVHSNELSSLTEV
jgi:hypothetical protein